MERQRQSFESGWRIVCRGQIEKMASYPSIRPAFQTAGLWVLISSATLGILTVLVWLAGDGGGIAAGLMLISSCILALLYCGLFLRNQLQPIATLSLCYFYFGFALPGLYQLRTSQYYWSSSAVSPEQEVVAATITLLATLGLSIGVFLCRDRISVAAEVAEPRNRPGIRRKAVLIASTIAVSITAAAFVQLGPIPFFAPRAAASIYYQSQGIQLTQIGLGRTLAQGGSIGALCLALHSWFVVGLRGPTVLVGLILAIGINLVSNFPLAIARYYMLALGVVVGLTALRSLALATHRVVKVLIPLALFFVFPTLGQFNRHTEIQWSFHDISLAEYLSHGDLDGFQSLMNVAKAVSIEGFSFGHGFLTVLLFFVPRSLWPSKAEPTGSLAAEYAHYSFFNISMPFPGELYFNGGYLLVFFGMILIGFAIMYLDKKIFSGGSLTEFAILLAAFSPILLRGSLLSTVSAFASSLFVIILSKNLASLRILPRKN